MPDVASPATNRHYSLVAVLHMSMENVWRLDNYIADAEREGDEELAHWYRKMQDNNRKAAEQGQRLLARRLEGQT
jgi:hypothetical protein